MHLNHEILYVLVAFLAGGLLGTINGFCLFGAWVAGWIFPAILPDGLASNDALAVNGNQRSKITEELPFAGSNKHIFFRDDIGNVTYKEIPAE